MKRILSFIIIAVLLVPALGACEKPEIYNLLELILNSRQDSSYESFESSLNIKINKDYLYESGFLYDFENAELEILPDELDFKITGEIYHAQNKYCDAVILIEMAGLDIMIYSKDNKLYFELNDFARVILDMLAATGFLDYPVKDIFNSFAEFNAGSMIYFDLDEIDLDWFGQYAEHISEALVIESAGFKPEAGSFEELIIPEIIRGQAFSDLKAGTESRLLGTPGYRYTELNIIISPDNYLHILARSETGSRPVLEPFKLDIDAGDLRAKIAEEPGAFFTEHLLPMRYIFELMGERVDWDDGLRQPYITRGGEHIYFEAVLINSRSYINLVQVLAPAQYSVSMGESGEYLEFKISRKD